jgi:predicted DNA-binding transcriptional regulator AlpA
MLDGTRLAFSIAEFCAAIGISIASYYNLPEDQRPREMKVGARRILISRQAVDEWITAREGRAPAVA